MAENITSHLIEDHTIFRDGKEMPYIDAMGHIVNQLAKQDCWYKEDYIIDEITLNQQGKRVMNLKWLTDRKGMLIKIGGVTNVWGEQG